MKAIKALPLHWEGTDGYYTYTPVIIIATDGKSEKCILSTIHIFISILLMTETCKHYDMTEDKQVCQQFLDANHEIVERADGIFEVVYNEKHYPLNERIRISYQSTPQEEEAAKAREEMAIEDDEHYLAYIAPLETLSHEEEERLEAKAKVALEANRAYRKALFGLPSERKEKLKAEYEAAYEDYREYRKTLVDGDAYQEDLEPPIDAEEEKLMAEEALLELYSKAAKG